MGFRFVPATQITPAFAFMTGEIDLTNSAWIFVGNPILQCSQICRGGTTSLRQIFCINSFMTKTFINRRG